MNKILYVDVWCRKNPWPYEIRWVIDDTQVFYEEFKMGSNNVGEYLAIYWWMWYYPDHDIYTDSLTAMSWIRVWKCKTKSPMDDRTRRWVDRARVFFTENQKWVKERLKFWDTPSMWENPADFGRKWIKKENSKNIPVVHTAKEKINKPSGWLEIMAQKNNS